MSMLQSDFKAFAPLHPDLSRSLAPRIATIADRCRWPRRSTRQVDENDSMVGSIYWGDNQAGIFEVTIYYRIT
jgi:hypothetical protein